MYPVRHVRIRSQVSSEISRLPFPSLNGSWQSRAAGASGCTMVHNGSADLWSGGDDSCAIYRTRIECSCVSFIHGLQNGGAAGTGTAGLCRTRVEWRLISSPLNSVDLRCHPADQWFAQFLSGGPTPPVYSIGQRPILTWGTRLERRLISSRLNSVNLNPRDGGDRHRSYV